MPQRRTWNSDSGDGNGATPEADPVQVVDDADAQFDDMNGDDLDEFGNEIHEHLDEEDLDEDLDGDVDDVSGLGHEQISADWGDEDEDEEEDAGDEDVEEEDEDFFNDTYFPSGLDTYGLIGRFNELRDHDDGDDDDNDDNDVEDEDDEGAAGIQGLLDIHRRLRNMPNHGTNDDGMRENPLLNALRGVFPIESGLGRLGLMDARMDRILRMLRSDDDNEIINALTQLSRVLLAPAGGIMGLTEFPVDIVSGLLVDLLRKSQNIEVLVMAARSVAHLVDNGIEGSVRALLNFGIVPVLRERFENIGYIDLVEHLVRVVKPVAAAEPKVVLEDRCLLPCLNFLDFFDIHIQKQILGAVDACAHAVSPSTLEPARELLAALPSPPSELVVGTLCQLVSAIAKRSPPDADLKEVVPQSMWETLVSHISAQTPHVSRVLRACSHIAARCPEYIHSRPALASLVAETLTQGSQDAFAALLATPKETLFSGLKLLQVLLPLPPPIGPFTGPYRKPSTSETSIDPQEVHDYALNAIPTAVAVYGASTNTPVRQLALLVIVQTAAAHPADFTQLAHDLQLTSFAAQVVAEGSENLALAVGGLDLAWDLAKDRNLLIELLSTGVTADLEDYCGDSEPSGTYTPTDDLKPVAEYMATRLLEQLRTEQVAGDYTELLSNLRDGSFNVNELTAAPLPELLRAGLLDALKSVGESALRKNLSLQLIELLQGAVSRLERFTLQLSPGHTSSALATVLGRSVNVRVSERNNSHHGWTITIPAVASLRAIEEFVRLRFSARRIAEVDARGDHFAFYVDNERVPADVSVLKALYNQLNHSSHGHHHIPQLYFERTTEPEPPAQQSEPDLSRQGEIGDALELLSILAKENEARNEPIPWSAFQNAKLTAKLTRQMADALAIAASMLPQWTFDTVLKSPFLYPLRTRLHFVQLTSFGLGRNLRLLRQLEDRDADGEDDGGGEPDDDERVLGRHRRQKYRLARDKLLEGALRLLEMSCKNPAVLDVMFFGEEGTGRGPTQEFFALASRELSRTELGIWRETPTGLFPSPETPNQNGLRIFEGVGRLMARALLDKRILDFRLNPAFFSIVLGSPPTLATLRRVDAQLAASLDHILTANVQDIAQMGLDFVLPGTSIELVPNGATLEVTADNAADFVALIVDRVVGSGISQQIEAFQKGFSSTIPVSALQAFMTDELVALCGAGRAEDWSEAALLEALRADHGYNMQSVPVQALVRVLASFDKSERRRFLMFATGSPHLPIGGFKALNPPFTVVVKHPDSDNVENDRYLPSVMTCVNYLKLPQYSSEEVMRAQLKLAMTEGSEAFPLS